MSLENSVLAVEVLQSKKRWLHDEVGYVPGGLRVRRKLLAKREAHPERPWVHVTLTYDPKPWESPRACYDASRVKRHVGEFVRRLRIELGHFEYFRVIEFQKNGMPHYHMLIDRKWISHALLMRTWGFGFVLVKPAEEKTFGYVVKYVSKGVDAPDWLLDYSSCIRMSSANRGFWGGDGHAERRPSEAGVRRRPATIREVMANPRRHLKTMMRIILQTGELVYRHGNMPILEYVEHLGALGFMGGVNAALDGCAKLVLPSGAAAVSLDQLLYCGESVATNCGGAPPC